MSPFYISVQIGVLLFIWLLLILPLFDSLHYWFFQISHREIQSYSYFDWYTAFFKALRQRPADLPSFKRAFIRKVLLYFSIVFAVFAISILPASSPATLNLEPLFLDFGSETASPVIVITLLIFVEFILFLIGFTFEKGFIAHACVEKLVLRLSCIMIFVGSLVTMPHVYGGATLRSVVEFQTQSTSLNWPAFGVLLNPIAFFCSLFALITYVRQWQDEEYPKACVVTNSLQSGFFGTDLIALRIARSLKYVLLNGFFVTVFWGGPYLYNLMLHPVIALGIFTLKIFLTAAFTLAAHCFIPRLSRLRPYRAMFLVFLPLLAVGYPVALVLREFLQYS